MYMQNYAGGGLVMTMGGLTLATIMGIWWKDVIREATFQGHHTTPVQTGMRYGMLLFIVSEVMFFFAFF